MKKIINSLGMLSLKLSIIYFLVSIFIIICPQYIKKDYFLLYVGLGIFIIVLGFIYDKIIPSFILSVTAINILLIIPVCIICSVRVLAYINYANGLFIFFLTALFLCLSIYFKEEKQDSNIVKSVFLSIPFYRLILLIIITILDYCTISIPFIKDIYSGIIFSIAFDSFYSVYKKYKIKCDEKNRNEYIEVKKKKLNEILELCKINQGYNANKFIDLLSREEGGMRLSEIKEIDFFIYTYIKQTCDNFFKQYPCVLEEQITTTYLYVWSQGKSLKDISPLNDPKKIFGF